MNPPGGGKIGAKGGGQGRAADLTLTLNTRDAPIEPYRAYFPFPAIFGGRFSSDSQNRVRVTNGKLTALSRGNSWATDLTVKTADGQATPLRMERLEINGIDFGWPTHARVAKVRLKAPAAELDRGPDGINVQKLFTPNPVGSPSAAPPQAPAAAPAAPSSAAPTKSPGPLETMDLHFKEIALEDGYVRFLDRTTTPPFSEDISKLAVTVRDLSNKKSQRANLSMQALIGGDSALDVRGELSAIGAPTYVDMVADLKKLALPTANPYVEGAIGWVIRRGELTTKLEYRIEEDKLDAKNDILVGNLKVSPAKEADEVKKRIGLPLGLIVALIKDGDGNVHVKVPISGTLSDKKFDFSDAIWTAVRNVLVNVLKAPFRAIGGLFTSGDDKIEEIKVDPLVFAAGSSVLGPELEQQAVRVADFMRRSPYVSLTLSSVTSPADVDTLKERAVAARLREVPAGAGDSGPGHRAAPLLPGHRQGRAAAGVDRGPAPAPAPARAGADGPARRAAPAPARRRARAAHQGGGHPGGARAGGGGGRRRRDHRDARAGGRAQRGRGRRGVAERGRPRGVRHRRGERLSALLYYARSSLRGGARCLTTSC